MKKANKKIKDVSGRSLNEGDQVFILDVPDPNLDMSHIIGSLTMGRIVYALDENTVLLDIENGIYYCPINKISKIHSEEDIDDIISHVSHDIETLQLTKESKILNDMLCIKDKLGGKNDTQSV